jgi:ribonuclease VapC
MFVDASAIVAVLNGEPERALMLTALDAAERVTISPAVKFEAVLTLARIKAVRPGRKREAAWAKIVAGVEKMLLECRAEEISITPEIGRLAIEACSKFGRGSGHRAKLNFGDCLAYACAKFQREPLLFVGRDFVHTDIPRV